LIGLRDVPKAGTVFTTYLTKKEAESSVDNKEIDGQKIVTDRAGKDDDEKTKIFNYH